MTGTHIDIGEMDIIRSIGNPQHRISDCLRIDILLGMEIDPQLFIDSSKHLRINLAWIYACHTNPILCLL